MKPIPVVRTSTVLQPDRTRVLVRPFRPTSQERAAKICAQVMALSEREVHSLLEEIQAEFGERHLKISKLLRRRFDDVRPGLVIDQELSEERELLLGAHFTHEYSFEAAALFNPSIVEHPDQSEVSPGSLRFILSLRATGEGHISSITFRTGLVDADGCVAINPPTRYCLEPTQIPNASYEKSIFARKLRELGLVDDFSRRMLTRLGDSFTLEELRAVINHVGKQLRARGQESKAVARKVLTLAQSNYHVQFAPDSRLSERVLFPVTPSQRNGIEDARFVLFQNADGQRVYYATYTAYDGKLVLPQFLETPDFLNFKFITLNGSAVQNKGMALFPEKINGHYAMLGRQNHGNIYLMFSDHLHFWNKTQLLLEPKFPWEFLQMGNCGSPLKTEAGWLVLSHGVGAMRKYCIGAFLLDLHDPEKVIGRLREPLIKPNQNEREGYVPNVVYSCGSILHQGRVILPYAMSDSATTFATVSLDDILAAMEPT
jgi:predicted GH43/DUF377 family glycosyl hydrolase